MIRRAGLKKMSMNTGPNMTPMVDIVMCILIFFMLSMEITGADKFLTSTLAAEKGTGLVEKPELKAPAVTCRFLIRLDAGGHPVVTAFDQEVTDLNEGLFSVLSERQKKLSEDVQVLIQPEKNVDYQVLITVYDQCIKSHFKNVAFVDPR